MADKKDNNQTPPAGGAGTQEAAPSAEAKRIAKLERDKKLLEEQVAELNEQNRALAKTKGNKHPVVKSGDSRYQLNHGVRYQKKGAQVEILQPADIALRPDVIAHLVKIRSTALTLID